MNERDIFDERRETKKADFNCSFCGERHTYDVLWLKRTKKKRPPGRLSEREMAQFTNSRDYLVRIDDTVNCKNPRCRRRFEIPSSQTVVFI